MTDKKKPGTFRFIGREVVSAGKDFGRTFKKVRAPVRRRTKRVATKIVFVNSPGKRVKVNRKTVPKFRPTRSAARNFVFGEM